ncbi:hypothetical protein PSTG_17392 [Puccinia striiformis f. sp. tritici PST-78]|uniref:Uncharacterized protein n=1 Tax=Puccinia striiformis f. sp. tritici PST-78 TaxID=1165861 RepID=A0A0L0UQV6_9BASI|nr:hypothetical protein PSTG_17392 [Puccinia striiformis f. sp. tritici PST-78]
MKRSASWVNVTSAVLPEPPATAPSVDVGYDEVYKDVVADLATVQVQLDTSRSDLIMVAVSFQVSPSKSVIASVLADTGAMANFVNKQFIEENQLSTRL